MIVQVIFISFPFSKYFFTLNFTILSNIIFSFALSHYFRRKNYIFNFFLGQTPLLYAIEKHTGSLSSTMVETLLNCGANPNEGDLINDVSCT